MVLEAAEVDSKGEPTVGEGALYGDIEKFEAPGMRGV